MGKYSSHEIETIRKALTENIQAEGPRSLSMDRTYRALSTVINSWKGLEPNPDYVSFVNSKGEVDIRFPFVPLKETDGDLYHKIMQDPIVEHFSIFAFFPEIMEHIDIDPNSLEIGYFPLQNRGLVAMVTTPQGRYILKPVQSEDEAKIAIKVDEIGIGPRQHNSLDGYMTEEPIKGVQLHLVEKSSMHDLIQVGTQLGATYRKMHDAGIVYADWIMQSMPAKSHVLVEESGAPKLIDFGVAVDISRAPEFSDAQIYHLLFGDPILKIGMNNTSPDQFSQFVGEQLSVMKSQELNELLKEIKEEDMANVLRSFSSASIEGIISYNASNTLSQAFLQGYAAGAQLITNPMQVKNPDNS